MKVLNVVNEVPVRIPGFGDNSSVLERRIRSDVGASILALRLSREGFQPSNSYIFVEKGNVVNFGLTFSHVGNNAWIRGNIKENSVNLSIKFQQNGESGKCEVLSLDVFVKRYEAVIEEADVRSSKSIFDDEQALFDLLAKLAKITSNRGKKLLFLTKEAYERLKGYGKEVLKKVLELLYLISTSSFALYPKDKTIDNYLIDLEEHPSKITSCTKEMKYESTEIQIGLKLSIYNKDNTLSHSAKD